MKASLFFIFPLLLGAEMITIIDSPDHHTPYSRVEDAAAETLLSAGAQAQKGRTFKYMRYGDPSDIVESAGFVIASFSEEIDIMAFATRYRLSNPRQISRMFHIWAFKNGSDLDDLALCAEIAANEGAILRYAKPDFIIRGTLY
ncbi:MAG: hypothetical protein LBT81_03030 [Helicobacteraceae bacterium]|jgi:hypothetical protein|nr:hypothetical protein [Helicobacteraceae bacterium]